MAEHEAVWMHAERRVTLVELSHASGLSGEVLRELVEMGSLAPADPSSPEPVFPADCVHCVRAAARLAADLELETHALALALTFMQRIERLEAEIRALKARG